MKHTLFLLLMVLLFSCQHKNNKIKMDDLDEFFEILETAPIPYIFPSSDSIEFQVELLEPREILYPILDSIIDLKNECLKEVRYVNEFIFYNFYGDTTISIFWNKFFR